MNLGEARALVRMYINEPKAQTWSDADLNGIIQEANREIYFTLVSICPQWFQDAGQFTYPANVTRLHLTGVALFGGGVIAPLVRVAGIFQIQTTGELSASNVPYPLLPKSRISDLYNSNTRQQQVTQSYGGSAAIDQQYSYLLLGPKLYIWPVPTQPLVLMIFAVPDVATPTVDANDLLVPAVITGATQLLNHHELVPLLAAVKAKTKVGDPDGSLSRMFDSRLTSSKNALAIDQQIQNPVQVRGVG